MHNSGLLFLIVWMAAGSALAQRAPKVRMVPEPPAGERRLPAGDCANPRFSGLERIGPGSAAELEPADLRDGGTFQCRDGAPWRVGDTTRLARPYPNKLLAIHLANPHGPLEWRYEPDPFGLACSDAVNRGASHADAKKISSTLDAPGVTVAAQSGKSAWKTTPGEVQKGKTNAIMLLLTALMPGSVVAVTGGVPPPPALPLGFIEGVAKRAPPPQIPAARDSAAPMEGRHLFVRFNCSGCHGGDAGGGTGPSLRDEGWIYGGEPGEVFASIWQGRAPGMPGWGGVLPAREIWKLVAYIGSLRSAQEPQPPR
jgi:cytochrome c oxidase cbb3-type subunit 3